MHGTYLRLTPRLL